MAISNIIKILKLCALSIIMLSCLGVRCEFAIGGPQPNSFGVEIDRMKDSSPLYYKEIFKEAFEDARPTANFVAKLNELDLATIDELDEREGELLDFINLHKNMDLSDYDAECYLCSVEKIINKDGVYIAGLAFFNTDPEVEREAVASVATEHISEIYQNQNPPPDEMLCWYIAWATAHELGHCFTLYHCDFLGCIMEEEINVTGNVHKEFCAACQSHIAQYWP